MANDYDKIFKEKIESLIPFLARKVLGIDAEILKIQTEQLNQ